MAAATQRAVRDVQHLSWPARSPDLSQIEQVYDMKRERSTLSPESARTIDE